MFLICIPIFCRTKIFPMFRGLDSVRYVLIQHVFVKLAKVSNNLPAKVVEITGHHWNVNIIVQEEICYSIFFFFLLIK